MFITYKYRIKSNTKDLDRQARSIRLVFNYCNETQKKAVKDGRKWLDAFDLMKLTSGTSTELGVLADSIHAVCSIYDKSRKEHKKAWLKFRNKKSLGWIPLRSKGIRINGGKFYCRGIKYDVFGKRKIPDNAKVKDGCSFSQDSKRRWYLNLVLEIPEAEPQKFNAPVGIDLGLKDTATLSNGEKIEAQHFYRKQESRLAQAQRGNKKKLVRSIHAKIANKRKDFLHKASYRITNKFNQIYIGEVSSSALVKTNLAKSVNDSGWYAFKKMLAYKSIRNGGTFKEVSERFTTQTCSQCGSIGGPKGYAGLNERIWNCKHCGCTHDRDVNSAINILRLATQPPAQGAVI